MYVRARVYVSGHSNVKTGTVSTIVCETSIY